MTEQIESVVLTEGYHDRAFWGGCLLHFGCVDASLKPGGSRRIKAIDPFGVPVGPGHHAFRSGTGKFVRVVPVGGKGNVPDAIRRRLIESAGKSLLRLVINVDSDTCADGSAAVGEQLTWPTLEAIVTEVFPNARKASETDIEIDGSNTVVSLVAWRAPDPPMDGLPHQHTLERILCAALMAVNPNRGPAVHEWLRTRPDATTMGPKEFAWSYLAGWHADVGSYEGFCSSIWNRGEIVSELKPRLEACGAWSVAQALST